MPWLLELLGQQQPWYWLCRIDRYFSYLRKDFSCLYHVRVEGWHCELYVFVPSEKFSIWRVDEWIKPAWIWSTWCELLTSRKYDTKIKIKSLIHCHENLFLIYQINMIEINSLRPSDAIWRQRSGSTLVQVMACCLTAPSHYLNQSGMRVFSF